MPRGDGSGPMGMGPMTGRGAGACIGVTTPGYANPGGGFGCGRGKSNRRNAFANTTPSRRGFGGFAQTNGLPVDEKELLSKQAKLLQDSLDEVNKRLAEL